MPMTIDSREVLKRIEDAPLLSSSASRLLQITADPEHSLGEVADIVKTDAALTARVLRVVNSAAFGLISTISSIDRAISYLGERLVIGIAIDICASQLFDKPLTGYEAQRGDLWRHDLRVAIASREIARLAPQDMAVDLAFTGGILHDIGKSILSEFLTGTAQSVLETIEKGEAQDYLEAERAMLGIDHAMVGYELARKWQLPEPLQQVIRFHHKPSEADEEHRSLVYAVHLGDIIAMMGGGGTGSDTLQYHMDSAYTDYLDISVEQLTMTLLHVEEEFSKMEASLLDGKDGGT